MRLKNQPVVAGALQPLLLLTLSIFLVGCSKTPEEIESKRLQQEQEKSDFLVYRVKVACQSEVEQRLLSPSTATFPSNEQFRTRWSESDKKLEILGYVDASNAFGAMLRKYFSCVYVRGEGDENELKTWHVESVSVDN